jgi:hypothetical protein
MSQTHSNTHPPIGIALAVDFHSMCSACMDKKASWTPTRSTNFFFMIDEVDRHTLRRSIDMHTSV